MCKSDFQKVPLQPIQLIDSGLIESTIRKAKDSQRKRTNHNFHELHEVYQRFLNVVTKGTYVQVHRHGKDPKTETFLVLQGKIGFLIFEEDGTLKERHLLSSEGPVYGIDIQPGVWHSLVCLSEVAVCFEGKSGPYDPSSDKEFSTHYPPESDPRCHQTVVHWESLFS